MDNKILHELILFLEDQIGEHNRMIDDHQDAIKKIEMKIDEINNYLYNLCDEHIYTDHYDRYNRFRCYQACAKCGKLKDN